MGRYYQRLWVLIPRLLPAHSSRALRYYSCSDNDTECSLAHKLLKLRLILQALLGARQ